MKFGIRECCDVVFRAKAPMKVGNKIFYKGEPVIYFDSLKTSTLEGAATTVYAQGGRGNARLMSWDGERTVTFTMEDALISPEGLAILTGAGLVEATSEKPIYVHTTEKIKIENGNVTLGGTTEDGVFTPDGTIEIKSLALEEIPYVNSTTGVYLMILDGDDNMICEPFSSLTTNNGAGKLKIVQEQQKDEDGKGITDAEGNPVMIDTNKISTVTASTAIEAVKSLKSLDGYKVLADYYVAKTGGAMEISITPDKFGGAFYIEGSTLFREYPSQLDLPAEIIIPNGRVQSNFTFTMAGSGDPSTFTFTVDAFPDYTRFDPTEKVLSRIQVIGGGSSAADLNRDKTNSGRTEDPDTGLIVG